MKKWEYLVSDVEIGDDEENHLDSKGIDGWELVSSFLSPNKRAIYFYFKRPLKEE